jgi:hypothetical protein
MIEVSAEQFFAYVNPRNIHPITDHPERTLWETERRELVGTTLPGWRNPGAPKVYMLTEAALNAPQLNR